MKGKYFDGNFLKRNKLTDRTDLVFLFCMEADQLYVHVRKPVKPVSELTNKKSQ